MPADLTGARPEDRAHPDQHGRTGARCPRCGQDAVHGIECTHCGRVIITALAPAPGHPPAWSPGCCPVCYTTDPQVWELNGRLLCTVCAEGRSRWGTRVQAPPDWRRRARRVTAWTDPPAEPAYATGYATT